MSGDSGFYLMHRGWMDSDVFGDEPLCERAAWSWIVENAAHKPTKVFIGGRRVTLQRGQLSHSIRHLALAWRWEKTKVIRFIRKLEQNGMIYKGCTTRAPLSAPHAALDIATLGAPSGAPEDAPGQNIISVCNYHRFQSMGRKRAPEDAPQSAPESAPQSAPPSAPPPPEKAHQYTNNTNKPSDADASADLTKVIFATGVAYLCANGSSDGQARSFFGGLRKDYSDAEILEVTMAAQRERVVNPRAWIVAGLQHRKPKKTLARSAL